MPAWLVGKPLNAWFQIPNTSGAGSTAVYAYSGMAFKPDTSEIIIALAGGHGDSADNRVVSLRLDQDAPTWVTRLGPSATTTANVSHYLDGRPAARHTYYSTHYVAQANRLMIIGAQFVYGSAVSFSTVDAFDLTTNTWDPAGTWPDTAGAFGRTLDWATGEIWSASGYSVHRWSPVTRQQVQLVNFNSTFMAMQNAFDPVRHQLVSLGFGDGWGYGNRAMMNAYLVRPTATSATATPFTFNASPAFTQLLADQPVSNALEYDPDQDRFYLFDNEGDGDGVPPIDGGRIYIITPNATTTWDLSILPLGPGNQSPPKGPGTGVWNRLRYVPALGGLVYLAAPAWNQAPDLYFIRTR